MATKKQTYTGMVESMTDTAPGEAVETSVVSTPTETVATETVEQPVLGTPQKTYTHDYAGYLQAQQDNYKADNTPTGAKGFGQFLKENYGDIAGQYSSTVRDIDTQYRKGIATYGQMAENLGKSGLSRSGYSDYLSGNAYTAAQQQRAAARLYADQSMKDAKMKYSEYLTGLDAQKQAETQAQAQVDQAQIADLNAYAAEQIANGRSAESVKNELLRAGATEEQANAATENGRLSISDVVTDTTNGQKGVMDFADITQYEQGLKGTKDENGNLVYDTLIEERRNKNEDMLYLAQGYKREGYDNYSTDEAMAAVSSYAEKHGVSGESDGDLLMNVAIDMHKNKYITDDAYQGFINHLMGHTISEDMYNPVTELNNIERLYDLKTENDGLSDQQYIDRLKQIGKNTEEAFGDLDNNLWMANNPTGTRPWSFEFYENGEKGKGGTKRVADIVPTAFDVWINPESVTEEKLNAFKKDFIPGKTYVKENKKPAPGYGSEDWEITFGTYNGHTAILYKTAQGKFGYSYNTNDNKGGTASQTDNMALMAFMCTPE